jgi:hypothetical protein
MDNIDTDIVHIGFIANTKVVIVIVFEQPVISYTARYRCSNNSASIEERVMVQTFMSPQCCAQPPR